MRKIIAAAFVSLDGVMQAPGGPEEDRSGGFEFGGWTVPFWQQGDDVLEAAMGDLFAAPYDLLLGRRTYDIFAAHWSHIKDDPIAAAFNAVTKYVATHRPDSLTWRNTEWLGEDVVARLRELKASEGKNVLTQGSSDLLQTLLAADLVDELRLLIFPVLLGKGKKLFGDGAVPAGLKLTSSKASNTGVILANYDRAGEVATGSFQLDPPTDAEVERRARLS